MNQAAVSSPRLDKWIRILNVAAVVAVFATIFVIFFYAPVERTMGNVQRLFYFHVGSAWVGAVAFLVALIGGVLYLRRPSRKYDAMAVAAIEIGLVFLSMAIVGGSVWGKPAWNTWWIWSPRLTLVTVAWLTYAAYFMLRGAIEDEEKRGRYAAVYAIISFAIIILTYISIRIFRDIHPVVFGGTTEAAAGAQEGLQEFAGVESLRMVLSLNVAVIAFTVLGAAWLLVRIRLQYLMDYSNSLKARAASQLGGRPALVSGLGLIVAQMQMPAGMGNPDHFNNYLVLGYVVMSSIALFYVLTLAFRQRNVEKDISLLQQVIDAERSTRRS
jgi:heme exporter protein C